MTDELELERLLYRYSNALSYIRQPTMGLHGQDPEQFALSEATESNARGALATCIRMATEALDDRAFHVEKVDEFVARLSEQQERILNLEAKLADQTALWLAERRRFEQSGRSDEIAEAARALLYRVDEAEACPPYTDRGLAAEHLRAVLGLAPLKRKTPAPGTTVITEGGDMLEYVDDDAGWVVITEEMGG